ncbi:response regulator transcription factor [Novosphingobium sp. Chol11]|uniref:winged helix-turn-helix transcriptional regulator n=1 Tax=Novosphingobium sp. Chol11 TaxID=1385763 RepID=UPI0025E247C2|nr:response regulator transcription factor [Novosphingobium sp. Chol11]
MPQIDILLTGSLAVGHEPFAHNELRVVFHLWDGAARLPLLEGRAWAFVDWLLPALSGLELCRRLRLDPQTENAHVTMILEDDDDDARRRALRAGADDYIVGPLTRAVLLDRVLAVQLPQQELAARTRRLGDLSLDLAALQVRWKDTPIPLMPNEFRLLRYLMEQPGRVFSRAQLIAALGKVEPPLDERTVDAWVSRLRRALREAGAGNMLRTVRALGYVLDRP